MTKQYIIFKDLRSLSSWISDTDFYFKVLVFTHLTLKLWMIKGFTGFFFLFTSIPGWCILKDDSYPQKCILQDFVRGNIVAPHGNEEELILAQVRHFLNLFRLLGKRPFQMLVTTGPRGYPKVGSQKG